MNHDQDKQQHEPEKQEPMQWLPFVHTLLGTCALIGGGIGGMLHFLNVGEGHAAYQIFVLRLSAFVLIILFFFLIIANMAMFVMESGRLDRTHADRKYVKFAIRCFTIMFMLMLAISAYGVLYSGGEFFIKGVQEYFEVLRTAQR